MAPIKAVYPHSDVGYSEWGSCNFMHSRGEVRSFLQAAEQLLDRIERAVVERLPICECFGQYHSARERKYPYYRIYLNNYVIYYVVIDDNPYNKIMEVRRMLYRKQNRDRTL